MKLIIRQIIQQIIWQIGQNFIIPEALKHIVDLNVENENHIKHLDNIYVGTECKRLLMTIIRLRARN